MESLIAAVKRPLRGFFQTPAFTITAVAALALGIGATTAIFSVVNAVLLKPLAVPDPDSLLQLTTVNPTRGAGDDTDTNTSPARFAWWRKQTEVLRDVTAVHTSMINITAGGTMEAIPLVLVSPEAFPCFGIRILSGRAFTAEEERPNGPAVAVLGEGLWKRRLGSDSAILGKTITLGGDPYTVIGVAAESAALRELGRPAGVYLPFRADPDSRDLGEYFTAAARLQPGVSLARAQEQLRASTAAYRTRMPNDLDPRAYFGALPFREALVADLRPLLWILLTAVGLVQLIACANVASLLLARAAARRREIAIRTALGASQFRTVCELLLESVLLSLGGGAAGLALGYGGIRALLTVNTAGLPLLGDNGSAVAIDWRVAGFVLAVSLATGILFGLLPALQGSRADLHALLKEGGGRYGTVRRQRARAVLVASEVGLAVVLLVGAALLIRTFAAMYSVNRGFETRNVLTLHTTMTAPRYLKTAGLAETIRQVRARMRALPGVEAAGATCVIPLEGSYDLNFVIVGRSPPHGQPTEGEGWSAVSPGFFETFRIPVKRGRTFNDRDDGASVPVVIINETLARKYWRDQDPLRDRIQIGAGSMKEFQSEPARQVIGVVGDIRDEGLNSQPRGVMYVPQAQLTDGGNAFFMARQGPMAWVVRTREGSGGMARAISGELAKTTGMPVSDTRAMDEVVWLSTAQQRFNMLLMVVFGAAALLLAAIGIYGLMAYTVERRTPEIGIRMALGAGPRQVRNMVVRQGMRLAIAGLAAGLAAAWALAQVFQSLLFGVKARDPLVFTAVPVLLGLVGLAAVWLPAERASRVNPLDSLRRE
jgi:predicted permease